MPFSPAAPVFASVLATSLAIAGRSGAEAGEAAVPTEATCSVRLASEEGSAAWKQAVADEDARVRAMPADASDCRSIEVHVALDGAVIVFTTRDGRQAVRHVASPAELGPTIDALLVTTPPAPAASTNPAPTTPAKVAPPPTAKAPARADRVHPIPRVEGRPGDRRAFAVVEAGGRVGLPGPFFSPSVAVGAHVVLNRWELGVDLTWEPIYGTSLPTPPGFDMLASAVGVGVGRREPVGRGFEIAALARAAVAIVHEEREGSLESGEPQGTRAQLRLGGAASIVYAREAPFRVRATIGGDYVPTKLGGGRSVDPLLPPLPSWALTFSIGLEADLP